MSASVVHDPEGWACNMRHVVQVGGRETYRGPEWACHLRANLINAGQPTPEEERFARDLAALGGALDALRGVVPT